MNARPIACQKQPYKNSIKDLNTTVLVVISGKMSKPPKIISYQRMAPVNEAKIWYLRGTYRDRRFAKTVSHRTAQPMFLPRQRTRRRRYGYFPEHDSGRRLRYAGIRMNQLKTTFLKRSPSRAFEQFIPDFDESPCGIGCWCRWSINASTYRGWGGRKTGVSEDLPRLFHCYLRDSHLLRGVSIVPS